MGARQVFSMDLRAARVATAPAFGASRAIDNSQEDPEAIIAELTGGEMADLVVEAAGEVNAINLAPSLVKTGGQILFFGVPRAHVFPFDFWTFFRKYCHTTSSGGAPFEPGRQSFRMAVDLIASGEIDVRPLITHRFRFREVMEAYELARTGADGAIKVVIEMENGDS
jgi:threonine dehydrogenase-like Zn-dependent dehydrogenase